MEKKFALVFFIKLQEVHLKKDVGLFPIYLTKEYFNEGIIFYPTRKKDEKKREYRGVIIWPVYVEKELDDYSKSISYLIAIKKLVFIEQVSHIMIFHYKLSHLFFLYYLKITCRTKVYLKLDCDDNGKDYIKDIENNHWFKLILNKLLLKKCDLITVETKKIYENLKKISFFSEKLEYAPNGLDDSIYDFTEASEKEKIIITVGRIGSYQKDTELFLESLRYLNFNDWRVEIIGPISDEFEKKIDRFYEENPKQSDKIIFTGELTDINQIKEKYKSASIFVLTSRYESSGLVLIEAALFGDYIISTDVGCVRDLSGDDGYFKIITSSERELKIKELSRALQEAMSMNINYEDVYLERMRYLKNNFMMSRIIKSGFFIDWSNN